MLPTTNCISHLNENFINGNYINKVSMLMSHNCVSVDEECKQVIVAGAQDVANEDDGTKAS